MSTATQIPLALPHRVALDGDDFFVSPSNQAAVDWIDRWPDWPGRLLLLVGPYGAGKSHLAAVWRQATGAALRHGPELTPADLEWVRAGRPMAVEDCGAGLDQARQVLLFHMINAMRETGQESGGSLLLTAENAPAHWPLTLPDLASRLRAAPVARIEAPDDSLMAALLVKQFSDRQLRVGADLLGYLLPRIERSFAALCEAVERLDAAALAEQRPITVPFARKVLEL